MAGYVINVRTLLHDFPEVLETVKGYYPEGPFASHIDYQCAWCLPADHICLDISDFVAEQIGLETGIDIVGDWMGDFNGECPFEPNEAYVMFDVDQDFAQIIRFLRAHDISEQELTFQEWTCRGSDWS